MSPFGLVSVPHSLWHSCGTLSTSQRWFCNSVNFVHAFPGTSVSNTQLLDTLQFVVVSIAATSDHVSRRDDPCLREETKHLTRRSCGQTTYFGAQRFWFLDGKQPRTMPDNGEHRGQHGRTEVCGDVQGVEVADFMHIFREVIKEAGFAYQGRPRSDINSRLLLALLEMSFSRKHLFDNACGVFGILGMTASVQRCARNQKPELYHHIIGNGPRGACRN